MRKQAIDQSLHAATAFLVIFAAHFGVLGGAIGGLLCGMIREVTEAGLPVTWAKIKAAPFHSDAPLDLTFWTLGGAIAGLVGGF